MIKAIEYFHKLHRNLVYHVTIWLNYPISLKTFSLASLLVFLISFFSWIVIFIKSIHIPLDPSAEGLDEFLRLYSFPIKSFAGFLALITVFATIKRVIITDEQLKVASTQLQLVSEQNRLSNFFKYREEFVNHMTSSYFHKFYSKVHPSKSSKELYYPYFYELYGSVKDFNATLNPNALTDISDFLKSHEQIVNNREHPLFHGKQYPDLPTISIQLQKQIPTCKFAENNLNITSTTLSVIQIFEKLTYKKVESDFSLLANKLISYFLVLELLEALQTFSGNFYFQKDARVQLYIGLLTKHLTDYMIFSLPNENS